MSESSDSLPRILAIDDEVANLRLLQALLEREGYRIETTTDPFAGLALFESLRPDLVLLDLHMPGMDGHAVMRQLRQSPHSAGYLPILVLTGDGSSVTRQKALAGGATDFVAKPFDGVEVTLRIRNLLEARALHAEVQRHNHELERVVAERTAALEVALARAEAAVQAKAHFLAKMSHELRTPLNPIRGALELLAEQVPANAAKLVQMANRNIDRMASLIDDILFLQGVEQGSVEPETYPVHLGVLAREVAEAAGAAAVRASLDLSVEVPDTLQPTNTDAVLLGGVIRRLVENSVRFTKEGRIVIRVLANEAGYAEALEVEDTGVGIAPDRLEVVMDPFEQADNSSTRQYEGAGLGLSICRRVVELIGFRLAARSEVGVGTTFTIQLPAGEDQAAL